MTARPAKQRLGRGLSALLGEAEGTPRDDQGEAIRRVPVSEIVANRHQPRRVFPAEQLAELEASIRENGLLQPLVVRPAPDDRSDGAEWELVAGERRWRAVRRLGWTEVPVLVREMDDRSMLVLAIVENIQRENLTPIEEAEAYQDLIDEYGYSQREIAESVGKDRSTIANLLRLLKLPARVRGMLTDGDLQMGHARALLAVDDSHAATSLAERAAREGWSVREVERRVRSGSAKKPAAPQRPAPAKGAGAEVRRIQTMLERRFSTRVRVHQDGGQRGRIEIPFRNADDFDRIVELLVEREE